MTRKRIISRLFGGAGNQLFQYAAGRALADRLGYDLILDARYVAGSHDRGDCFEHFANARFLTTDDLPPAKTDGVIKYGIWRVFGSPKIYREAAQRFDPKLLQLTTERYLHGYWQAPKYFEEIAPQLRDDLTFTTPLDAANEEIAQQIAAASHPVALHVRRGDYIASGAYAAMQPDYYRRAATHIADAVDGAITCFVFSNDPNWARSNLELGHETRIVDINSETTGHFDLHLQSLCAHNVIANSTFSWWAAWLNRHTDKIVIAPKNWFAEGAADNPDLIPADWTRL